MKEITIRFKYSKTAGSKYLSHLDITRVITRAVNRSHFNVLYSQGFNPKPKISFSDPLPLGVESYGEYCDIRLNDDFEAGKFKDILNDNLPHGINVIEVAKYFKKIPSLSSEISVLLFELKANILKNKVSVDITDVLTSVLNVFDENYDSLYNYNVDYADDSGIIIRIFGYARIFKDRNNKIFKYNNFIVFFNKFLLKYDLELKKTYKKEAFFLKDNKLISPFKVL
jgi:uncharacterized protein (DUF2344 family)